MSKGDFSGLAKTRKNISRENTDFIEGATMDGSGTLSGLDHKARRDFKSIRLAFNEYEYRLLERAAANANLSLITYVRSTWMAKAKKGT